MRLGAQPRDGTQALLGLGQPSDSDAESRHIFRAARGFRRRSAEFGRYRFGRGEYQYLAYPLPAVVATLRAELYAGLAPVATRWMKDLGKGAVEFPPTHEEFLRV